MAYLLDANVFISASRLWYARNFHPGFWEWLEREIDADALYSVEKVGDELKRGNDELADWAKARGESFFLPPDEKLQASLGEVTQWARSGKFTQTAIHTFMASADLYLIAHAKAHGLTVVTLEAPAPDAKKRIVIPTACLALKVKYIDLVQLLLRQNAFFVLGTQPQRRAKRDS